MRHSEFEAAKVAAALYCFRQAALLVVLDSQRVIAEIQRGLDAAMKEVNSSGKPGAGKEPV